MSDADSRSGTVGDETYEWLPEKTWLLLSWIQSCSCSSLNTVGSPSPGCFGILAILIVLEQFGSECSVVIVVVKAGILSLQGLEADKI